MTLVTFNVDISPYCKGDVVDLNKEQKAHVDSVAKERSIKVAYAEVSGKKAKQASAAKEEAKD